MLTVPFGGVAVEAAPAPPAVVSTDASVLTYHGDSLRTGWDRNETALNTTDVNSTSFGLLGTVALDDQVDAEPLVVQSQAITAGPSPGTHDVVYVVTESDSVYAIDAESGAVLLKTTLGAPLPATQLPGQCDNNGANIGIDSTPVIDRTSQTLYLIADTFESGHAVFRIHALDLGSLVDKVAPVVVSATRKLSNGASYSFSAGVQRQRAALLESGDKIYAGFSSFCDFSPNRSRGFVLGWHAGTLAPLAAKELTDSAATSPNTFFLASVWMSGFGLASDNKGVYFATGNSDPSSYDMGVHDIQESVVRLSPDLSTIQSFFTPSDYAALDGADNDLGAGGVLLVPDQTKGSVQRIAAAGGKDGNLYLLNRDALGGYSPNGNNVLADVFMGHCWCGPSYFVGADHVPRIVTSGNVQIESWRLQTAPSVALTQESISPVLPTIQDPGLFTTVSSNGTAANSAVVWTVTRPATSSPATVSLDALDPASGAILFSAVAGTWPNVGGNANIVPTVFNGHVYVASFGQLAIFGLLPAGSKPRVAFEPQARRKAAEPGVHEVYGVVETAPRGSRFLLRARGKRFAVDATAAAQAGLLVRLYPGEAVFVRGHSSAPNSLEAISVARAKPSPAGWAPDR